MSSRLRPKLQFSIETLKAPALALGALLILFGLGSWLVNGFDTATRVLLAVGILLFGVFVAIDPEDVWQRMTTRTALYGANALLLAAIVIGILGLLNVVAQNRHQRWDLTANKQFSLSDQSIQIVRNLPQPVAATAFYSEGDGRRTEIQDLLREYETRSDGKITFELVDPVREPFRAQAAGVREDGTTVLTMGDRRQSVTGARESDVTTGLLRLVNPTQKKIYFTVGHGERRIDTFRPDSYSQLKTSLESDNFVVEPLQVEGQSEIPQDASVVVIANPTAPFGEQAQQALKAYLERGGKLMLLTEPVLAQPQAQPGGQQGPPPPVNPTELLATWGLEIGSAPILEGNPSLYLQPDPSIPVIVRFPNQKITEGLNGAFFPTATYVNTPQDGQSGATITPILQTSDRSWAETELRQQPPRLDEGTDPKGPLNIGVTVEADAPNAPAAEGGDEENQTKTRVVIFGDSDFIANDVQNIPVTSSNRDLFLNAANWLAEDEQLISIRPKERDQRTLFLSAGQSQLVLASSILFLPLIVLAIGGFVWWRRR